MVLTFTGTGNSRYVARRIADALGEPLLSINDRLRAGDTAPVETVERLILVTPTYAWRIPRPPPSGQGRGARRSPGPRPACHRASR